MGPRSQHLPVNPITVTTGHGLLSKQEIRIFNCLLFEPAVYACISKVYHVKAHQPLI